jgi:dihydroorotate dehydrogenase electron transfer subunit
MSLAQHSNRNPIFQEDARIIDHLHFPGDQHILRLHAPKCAREARAGQFVHLQCDPLLPLRRPFSIMRSNPDAGWIELLYKVVGHGTSLLSSKEKGQTLSSLGPIGNTFELTSDKSVRLLIGGGVGIPPMIFLAETIAQRYPEDISGTLVIMGSEVTFPFELQDSAFDVGGIESTVNRSIASLESMSIASRLCSLQDYPGCYKGYAPELARKYLNSLAETGIDQVQIFSCGPHPMLAAVKQLASEFDIGCQVSLEETMACAVGGCAGCVVEVMLPEGNYMKRVCVDGPVFEAETINF